MMKRIWHVSYITMNKQLALSECNIAIGTDDLIVASQMSHEYLKSSVDGFLEIKAVICKKEIEVL